jgi:hypothetical protein
VTLKFPRHSVEALREGGLLTTDPASAHDVAVGEMLSAAWNAGVHAGAAVPAPAQSQVQPQPEDPAIAARAAWAAKMADLNALSNTP